MKVAYTKSIIAAATAALVVSSAFAQTGAYKGTAQTKTTPPQSMTKAQTKSPAAPKVQSWVGNVKTTNQKGSFTFTQKKSSYTVKTDKAQVTMNKKPFAIDKITAGSLVTIKGTMSGKDIMATEIKVDRLGPAKHKKAAAPVKKQAAPPVKKAGGAPTQAHIGN